MPHSAAKFRFWIALVFLFAVPAPLCVAENPAPANPPIVPPRSGTRQTLELFNGRDLSGWKGDSKYWSVKDGMIVGKNTAPVPVSTYLLTDRSFSDFRLTCKFRLAESEMHSGIAMWGRIAPDKGDPFTYAGHLVMFPSGYGFWDLYGRSLIHKNADVARAVGKQHDWNRIEILAQGNRIRFVLNGKLVSDWREPEPERIHEAPLGLQLHSNKVPQEVQFKDLRLETFPDDRLLTLAAGSPAAALRVYIGTYTNSGKSRGIYRTTLDLQTGRLSEPVLAGESINPSFLAIHPSRRFLYAVSEVNGVGGRKSGGVRAFAIDSASGDLQSLNEQLSGGAGPCHVTVDRGGKHVLVANYAGGSAAVLAIDDDGRLGPMTGFAQHQGSSVDPQRQREPHAHSINLDAPNHFAFVADLGLDKVMSYRFDPRSGTIKPNDPLSAGVAPGSGPRHFAFHPDGRRTYVINEMASTVTAFDYDPAAGTLREIQSISTLPAPTPGNTTAEVQVHPSGKFLYGSNRGHNSIAIFSIDSASGKLSSVGYQGQGLKTPRNFGIDPTGRYLIVANQDGDSLIAFRINQRTGELEPTGSSIAVGKPVCVKFVNVD